MMGVTPAQYAERVLNEGADIIGTNCGNGMERMISIVKEIRAVNSETPILVHANAGLPTNVDGKDEYPETPSEMSGFVKELISVGVNIVGGCCGTSPDHITAIKNAVEMA